MLTINIYLRFALIAVSIIGGAVLAFAFGFWYAFPFFLAALTLIVGYILLGTVQSAAQFMQATDLEATEKRLNLTLSPKLLCDQQGLLLPDQRLGSHGPKAD
ncbi:MAG: hypothetical protein IPK21_04895 [Haliscomenobacter sp.]|nr:hypothetical protein [Haliscomenobacter sp.]